MSTWKPNSATAVTIAKGDSASSAVANHCHTTTTTTVSPPWPAGYSAAPAASMITTTVTIGA